MANEDSAETLTASPSLDQDRPLESTSASYSSSSFRPSDPAPPPVIKSLTYRKLNAKAPEFIPRSSNSNASSSLVIASSASTVTSPGSVAAGSAPPTRLHMYQSNTRPVGPTLFTHVPVQGHFPVGPYHVPVQYNRQYYAGYVAANQQQELVAATVAALPGTTPPDSDQGTGGGAASKDGITDEVYLKIVNQVEYYFSDLNLATTDHLIRFMNKDPEGNVPISVVASFKKIKALINSNFQLADILRRSEKLVVSEDGKKVKRLHRLTESDMEDLQSRIVVAENLPEDHCHQTLMKIFSAVGSVKTIRTCQPQTNNGGASPASRTAKSDGVLLSSKLHAFVEYESVELAEKAITELNDENNWRNGLKVRLLRRPKAKSSQVRVKKAGQENDRNCKANEASSAEDSLQSDAHSNELAGGDEKEGQQKKVRSRGRGKGRGRPQPQPSINHENVKGYPPTYNMFNNELPNTIKQSSVPRMPDGTRGFSMGRGKPVTIKIP